MRYIVTNKKNHRTEIEADSMEKAIERVENTFDLSLEPYTVDELK